MMKYLASTVILSFAVLAGSGAALAQDAASERPAAILVYNKTGDLGDSTFTVTPVGPASFEGENVVQLKIDPAWADPGFPCDGTDSSYYHVDNSAWVACLKGDVVQAGTLPHTDQFRFPLEVGAEWTARFAWLDYVVNPSWSGPVSQQQVVEAKETITVPAGTFEAFKVTTISNFAWTQSHWYAPELGIVIRTDYERYDGNGYGPRKYTTELAEIRPIE